jgi:hypothetical protein
LKEKNENSEEEEEEEEDIYEPTVKVKLKKPL